MPRRIPEHGVDKETLLNDLKARKEGDAGWQEGRVFFPCLSRGAKNTPTFLERLIRSIFLKMRSARWRFPAFKNSNLKS